MLLDVPTVRFMDETMNVYSLLLGIGFLVLAFGVIVYLWRMRTPKQTDNPAEG